MSEATAGSDDAYSQGLLRSIRAKLLARGGSEEEAIQIARDAVAIDVRADGTLGSRVVLYDLASRKGSPSERPGRKLSWAKLGRRAEGSGG